MINEENINKCFSESTSNIIQNSDIFNLNQTTIADTTISKDNKISYENFFNNNYTFLNNTEKYNIIINNIIKTYSSNTSESLIIMDEDNNVFQLTTGKNELECLKNNKIIRSNLSIIDLSECETMLKKENNISDDISLIILKYEKLTNILSQKNIQYEVFDPYKKEKLELNICKNTKINIYIPTTLDENNLFKYNSSSDYYNDLCYSYTSTDKIDIILNDRRKEYIKNNMSLCEDICEYNEYNLIQKVVKCECYVKIKFLVEIEINKDKLFRNFRDIEQITNFNIIKCYKQLFSKNGLKNNIGNYIFSSILFITLILSIFFKIKGYKKFLEKVDKIIDTKKNNNNINDINNFEFMNNNHFQKRTKKKKNHKKQLILIRKMLIKIILN